MQHNLLAYGLVLYLSIAALPTSKADSFAISSLTENGYLTWTNSLTAAVHRVEWSPSLTSTWRSSWQYLVNVETHSGEEVRVDIPMFFRVVSSTSYPPSGMVLVDAGPFLMGDNYDGQLHFGHPYPVHNVNLSAYYIDRYEISGRRWATVRLWAITNGYTDLAVGQSIQTNHPVTLITWYDAVKWCNARSEREGLIPVYYSDTNHTIVYREGELVLGSENLNWSADGYRLPTEAEWEKAARGGLIGHHFPFPSYGSEYQDHWDGSKGNTDNSGDPYFSTTPIGYYNGSQQPEGSDMANSYGLYDMEGNVNEWCWDWHDDGYYSVSPVDNPRGPVSSPDSRRSVRGGKFNWGPNSSRCSYRDNHFPEGAYDYNGFRCVKIH